MDSIPNVGEIDRGAYPYSIPADDAKDEVGFFQGLFGKILGFFKSLFGGKADEGGEKDEMAATAFLTK